MSSKKKEIILLLIAITVTVLLLEIGCRMYQCGIRKRTVQDSLLGTVYRDYYFLGRSFKPNSGGAWQAIPEMKINSLGFRGDEFSLKKDESTFRIICFGGSTSHSGNYPEKLSDLFRNDAALYKKHIEVINAAVPRWGSTQSLIQFITRAIYLEPDMIVIFHANNDWDKKDYHWLFNLPEVDYQQYSGFLRNHSVLNNFVLHKIEHLKNAIAYKKWQQERRGDGTPSKEILGREQSSSTQLFQMNIENFIAIAKYHNINVVLVTMPLNYDEDLGYAENISRANADQYVMMDTIVRRVRQINDVTRFLARKHQVGLIDVARRSMYKNPDNFVDMIHFSEKGADVFAKLIEKGLRPLMQNSSVLGKK